MTDKEYAFLCGLMKKAKSAKEKIDSCPPEDIDQFVRLREEFNDLDIIEQLINSTVPKIHSLDKKISEVNIIILKATNGTVQLDKKTIEKIIEKSVI